MGNKTIFKSKISNMKLVFCSVDEAEKVVPQSNRALISIGMDCEDNVIPYEEWGKNVVRLKFDDITRKEVGCMMFFPAHAHNLIKFVKELPEEVDELTIHCWAGVSRSGAVIKFLTNSIYPECKSELWDKEYNIYNPHVYKVLNRVWRMVGNKANSK